MCVKKCFAQVVFGRFFDGHSDVPSTLIARTHDGTLDVSYEGLLSVPSDRHIQVPMSLPKCKELRSDRHSKRPTDVCTSKTHRAFSTRMCTDVTSGCTLPTSITVFRYTLRSSVFVVSPYKSRPSIFWVQWIIWITDT